MSISQEYQKVKEGVLLTDDAKSIINTEHFMQMLPVRHIRDKSS